MLEAARSRAGKVSDSLAVRGAGDDRPRDLRLDVFRGLALVTIYINHVPGTVFEHFTTRNYGFSDAAEAFVIMSGIAAGLAYSGAPPAGRPWYHPRRAWGRAWTLYQVHIVTSVMAIGIAAAAARWFGAVRMIEINNIAQFFDDQIGVMIGLPTLGHQIGYFNILPLYAVLITATPLLIWIGKRWPLRLFLGSLAVWVLAGAFRLNFPAYPNPGGWFFNPLAWQLIFVVGLLTGLKLKLGERLVPVDRRLVIAALGFVLFVLAWRLVPPIAQAGRAALHAAYDAGLPFYLVSFDKTFVAVPRGLHALALLYLVSVWPWARVAASSGWARPFALMGRHALPVFATGSVLCILAQAIKSALPPSIVVDAWVIVGGLLIQVMLAVILDRLRRPAVPATR